MSMQAMRDWAWLRQILREHCSFYELTDRRAGGVVARTSTASVRAPSRGP